MSLKELQRQIGIWRHVVISLGARQMWKANDFSPKGMSSKPLKLAGLKHVLNRYRVVGGVVL